MQPKAFQTGFLNFLHIDAFGVMSVMVLGRTDGDLVKNPLDMVLEVTSFPWIGGRKKMCIFSGRASGVTFESPVRVVLVNRLRSAPLPAKTVFSSNHYTTGVIV